MNTERDPFERLPDFVDPEPDPAVMTAVITQSREAFANRQSLAAVRPQPMSGWLRRSAQWLMPAGVGLAALTVAVVVAPGLLQTTSGPDRSRDVVADLPAAAPAPANPPLLSRSDNSTADELMPPASTRMGMQPSPSAPEPLAETSPQTVSRFEGDGVVVGTRLDATGLEIFLPEISGEDTIDVQGIMPGEDVEILGAFARPVDELVIVRFRVEDVRFWRVYRLTDGGYGRDPERSQIVSDAADRPEVERRLDQAGI